MSAFPKRMYITIEGDANDLYYVAHDHVPELNTSTDAAIYELRETGAVAVTRAFVKDNPPTT